MMRCVIKLFRHDKRVGKARMLLPKIEVYDLKKKTQPLAITSLNFDCTNATGAVHDILISAYILDIIPTEVAFASCSVIVPNASDFLSRNNDTLLVRVPFVGMFQGPERKADIAFKLDDDKGSVMLAGVYVVEKK
jgi:hypothetical protein